MSEYTSAQNELDEMKHHIDILLNTLKNDIPEIHGENIKSLRTVRMELIHLLSAVQTRSVAEIIQGL